MTPVEIQYKIEQAKESLDKCFDYLGEDKPNFIEADYWLYDALNELNEIRKASFRFSRCGRGGIGRKRNGERV